MTDKVKETEKVEPEVEVTEENEQEQTLEEARAELEETRKALKKANKEAADRRKKLDALETAEEERKKAELTEVERLQKERDEAVEAAKAAEIAANAKLLKATIISKAAGLNFEYPQDVYAQLDKSELKLADDGSVDGLDDALKALAKDRPNWLKDDKRGATLGATHPAGVKTGETDAQRRERLGI